MTTGSFGYSASSIGARWAPCFDRAMMPIMRTSPSLCILVLALLVPALLVPACKRDDAPAKEARGASSTPETEGLPPKPKEHPNPGPGAVARKEQSERRLVSESVKTSRTLPVIDSEAEARIRTQDAVVDRAIALMIVAVKAEGLEQEEVVKSVSRFTAAPMFSPQERAFVADLSPTQRDRAKFGWRYESLEVMLWALGFEPELTKPSAVVDAGKIVEIVLSGPAKLRGEAKLRSAKELLDAADLIYRYDWACVDARVSDQGKPGGGIDCEVVVERHHALNWLIGYMGQGWDDVSTDT